MAVDHAVIASTFAMVFLVRAERTSDSATWTTKIDSASGGFECAIATLTTMNSSDRTAYAAGIVIFAITTCFADGDEGGPVVEPTVKIDMRERLHNA